MSLIRLRSGYQHLNYLLAQAGFLWPSNLGQISIEE
jgi:hypothetical protein